MLLASYNRWKAHYQLHRHNDQLHLSLEHGSNSFCCHFLFTNKVELKASHASGINTGSNEDYLFSSCSEFIGICFRLPAHTSGCRCFLLSCLLIAETQKQQAAETTILSKAAVLLPHPAPGICLQPMVSDTEAIALGTQPLPPDHTRLRKCFKSRSLSLEQRYWEFVLVYWTSLHTHSGHMQCQKRQWSSSEALWTVCSLYPFPHRWQTLSFCSSDFCSSFTGLM